MDYMKDLHELCDMIGDEISEQTDKIKKAGKMSAGDLEAVDKLTHALKSIKTVMMEDDGEYSSRMDYPSYARRRDRMGRYSSRYTSGYSRDGEMDEIVDRLRGVMADLPQEKQREVQKFIAKVEQM